MSASHAQRKERPFLRSVITKQIEKTSCQELENPPKQSRPKKHRSASPLASSTWNSGRGLSILSERDAGLLHRDSSSRHRKHIGQTKGRTEANLANLYLGKNSPAMSLPDPWHPRSVTFLLEFTASLSYQVYMQRRAPKPLTPCTPFTINSLLPRKKSQ